MEPEKKYTEEWCAWYLREHHFNQEHLRIAIANGLDVSILKKYILFLVEKQRTVKGH